MTTTQQELQAELLQSLYALRHEAHDMAIANVEWSCGPVRNFRVVAPKPHSREDMEAVTSLIKETEDQIRMMMR